MAAPAPSSARAALAASALSDVAARLADAGAARAARRAALEAALRGAADDAARLALVAAHEAAERAAAREARRRAREGDYEVLRLIGRGAFGEVALVRDAGGALFALKKLDKRAMLRQNQWAHVSTERRALSAFAAAPSAWVVPLHEAFQSDAELFLVMDFVPGGDLMSLLIARDTLGEAHAQLLAAELVAAIESVHAAGYIHRDVKVRARARARAAATTAAVRRPAPRPGPGPPARALTPSPAPPPARRADPARQHSPRRGRPRPAHRLWPRRAHCRRRRRARARRGRGRGRRAAARERARAPPLVRRHPRLPRPGSAPQSGLRARGW